jgi:hypothetical protein
MAVNISHFHGNQTTFHTSMTIVEKLTDEKKPRDIIPLSGMPLPTVPVSTYTN